MSVQDRGCIDVASIYGAGSTYLQALVDLDARVDALLGQALDKGLAGLGALVQGLLEQDDTLTIGSRQVVGVLCQ